MLPYYTELLKLQDDHYMDVPTSLKYPEYIGSPFIGNFLVATPTTFSADLSKIEERRGINLQAFDFNPLLPKHNIMIGSPLDDSISGARGWDTIINGEGSDTLWGGEGRDLAVFQGALEDYEISIVDEKLTIQDSSGWVDVVNPDIELIQFDNKIYTNAQVNQAASVNQFNPRGGVLFMTVDTGLNRSKFGPDSESFFFTNEREIPGNGLDDDQNGWIDDYHGPWVGEEENDFFLYGNGGHGQAITIYALQRTHAAQEALPEFDLDIDYAQTPSGDNWFMSAKLAIEYGAKVVSMSLGFGPSHVGQLEELGRTAKEHDALVVIWDPDGGEVDIGDTGEEDHVIELGFYDFSHDYISADRHIDLISMNGSGINSEGIVNTGTDISLIWAANPALSSQDVISAIRNTTQIGDGSFIRESELGGVLDRDAAIQFAYTMVPEIETPNTDSAEVVVAEFGRVTANHIEQRVYLDNDFVDPVVILSITSCNGNQVVAPRLTEVSSDGFSFFLQEAEYLDSWHALEEVSFVVVERGSWKLSDGSIFEAGSVSTDALSKSRNFEAIDFSSSFGKPPAVLSQAQTFNSTSMLTTRQRNVEIDSFDLALERQEISNEDGILHTSEDVGFLAVSQGFGSDDGFDFYAGTSDNGFNHQWGDISFDGDISVTPQFFAQVSSHTGDNSAFVRSKNISHQGVSLKLQEDQSMDSETWHLRETLSFFFIEGSGQLTGVDSTL